jgi:hypothetical protein
MTVATQRKRLDMMKCLVKELGADVNLAHTNSHAPLFRTLREENLDVMRYLVKELGADVNQADSAFKIGSCTALSQAIIDGNLALVQCLVGELGADVNLETDAGAPLVMAAMKKHQKIIKYLIKHGANTQATCAHGIPGHCDTAEIISRLCGGPAEQTAYLMAKTHCSNPGCDGAGLKKCTGCKHAGAVLWAAVPVGALAGAQNRVQGGCHTQSCKEASEMYHSARMRSRPPIIMFISTTLMHWTYNRSTFKLRTHFQYYSYLNERASLNFIRNVWSY